MNGYRGFAATIVAITGEIMRSVLIKCLGVCVCVVLTMGSMAGCNKEIKEAAKPAQAKQVNT